MLIKAGLNLGVEILGRGTGKFRIQKRFTDQRTAAQGSRADEITFGCLGAVGEFKADFPMDEH